MTRQIFACFTFLLFVSCRNSNGDKTNANTHTDSFNLLKADTIPAGKKVTENATRPDSVNKTNSNTVATEDESYIQKATVSKSDSSIWLAANMKLDHRIFGYAKPDTTSRKMILISIFTNDVKGNPFKCLFGSYYETNGMADMELKYVSTEGHFVKANILKNNVIEGLVYFGKEWIKFEE